MICTQLCQGVLQNGLQWSKLFQIKVWTLLDWIYCISIQRYLELIEKFYLLNAELVISIPPNSLTFRHPWIRWVSNGSRHPIWNCKNTVQKISCSPFRKNCSIWNHENQAIFVANINQQCKQFYNSSWFVKFASIKNQKRWSLQYEMSSKSYR